MAPISARSRRAEQSTDADLHACVIALQAPSTVCGVWDRAASWSSSPAGSTAYARPHWRGWSSTSRASSPRCTLATTGRWRASPGPSRRSAGAACSWLLDLHATIHACIRTCMPGCECDSQAPGLPQGHRRDGADRRQPALCAGVRGRRHGRAPVRLEPGLPLEQDC